MQTFLKKTYNLSFLKIITLFDTIRLATHPMLYQCRLRGSNLRPTRYECVALPTELNRLIEFVVKYSENLPKGPTLLEKTTSRLINLIRFRASWDYVVMFKGFPPNGVLPTPISVGH